MQKFKDKKENEWILELTVGSAKRVKLDCGVDLINITDFDAADKKSPLEELAENPFLMVDVLFSLCRKQAEEKGIDDIAFGGLFDFETVQDAVDALVQEIINFTPPVRRKLLQKIYDKNKQIMGETEKQADELMGSPEFDKDLETLMKSSTELQVFSE